MRQTAPPKPGTALIHFLIIISFILMERFLYEIDQILSCYYSISLDEDLSVLCIFIRNTVFLIIIIINKLFCIWINDNRGKSAKKGEEKGPSSSTSSSQGGIQWPKIEPNSPAARILHDRTIWVATNLIVSSSSCFQVIPRDYDSFLSSCFVCFINSNIYTFI